MSENSKLKRHQLIKDIVTLTETQVYVELGVAGFEQINHVAPYVSLAIGVDISAEFLNRKTSLVKFYNMSTDQFLQEYKVEGCYKIDTLFIDADHSFEQSYKDFLNFSPLVKENGIILLHDTCPPNAKYAVKGWCNTVFQTAWKIRTEHSKEFEICTIPGDFGVSIIRKLDRQCLWR